MAITADRVLETTTTTGTGNITLGGAVTGHQTFNSAFGTSVQFYYCISGGTEWEVGEGHLSASTTLVRDRVMASTNSGAAVSFSAGAKNVFATIPGDAATLPKNVRMYGAVGDGTTDDTTAIQAAINDVANGSILMFPKGAYKITTTLTVPSNVTIIGEGRNFGTSLNPTSCLAFNIDGSGEGGGWKFRILIKDMLITATNASGTSLINLKAVYNVELKNVFIYDQPTGVTNGIYLTKCNDIVLEDVIAYATSQSVTRGIYVDGATSGPVSLKLVRPDLEIYNRCLRADGEVVMDVFSPYMEQGVVGYDHQITSGQVNIFGGVIGNSNGYPVYVLGPNLAVYGTDIDPYTSGSRGGLGIECSATTARQNVYFYNIPRIANSGFIDNTVNQLSCRIDPPPYSNHYHRRFQIKKTLSDNVSTNLVDFANFDHYVSVKLRLHGKVGLAMVIKEYQFCIYDSTSYTTVFTEAILDTSAGNWTAAMTLGLSGGTGKVTMSCTVDTGGALGDGQTFDLWGEMDVTVSESGVGGIYML